MQKLISELTQKIRKSYFLQGFLIATTSFLITFLIVSATPPTSPYRPGETLNPSCSPNDPNCTVSPPLPTFISTTTLVELNNNLLNFSSGTISFLGINIGIGTTTPQYKLHVLGRIQASDDICTDLGGICLSTAGTGNIGGSGSIGQLAFFISTSTISGDNNLYWDNTNKRLGIGTTNPQYTLDVIGTAHLRGNSETTGLFINSNGNIGIGTTNPTAKLYVKTTNTTTVPFQVEALTGFDPNLMPGWSYRRAITIDNFTNPNNLTDYQVLVTLDTATLISNGKMRSDCGDIRFTDSDGSTLLNYWLESGCNTSNTKIWVKVPSIPANSTKIIYVYYGNSNAISVSDVVNTFISNQIFLVTGRCTDSVYCNPTDNHNEFDYIRERVGISPFTIDNFGYVTAVNHGSNLYGSSDYYYSRYRFLYVPATSGTYYFGTNSDDASEVTIFPSDGYGGGIRTTHPYGQHDVVAYWYGIHGSGTCGSSGTIGSRNLTANQGYWIDYMQSEWGGAQYSQMCINIPGIGWVVVDTANSNFNNRIFARKYTTPEPTTSIEGEEISLSQQTAFYIQNQTGYIGIGTTNPTRKLHVEGITYISGNVGIGTPNPVQKLHVEGSSYISGNVSILGKVGIGITNPVSRLAVNGGATFGSEYAAEAVADGDVVISGNLGIGTKAPKAKLDVKGKLYVDPNNFGGTPITPTISLAVGDTDTGLNSAGDGILDIYSNGVNTISIRSGKVGIGISSPTEKLSILGNIGLSGGDRFIGTIDNFALSLRTNNIDRIYITNTGNVGIGTTTPQYTLDVNGTIRATKSLTAGMNVETLTGNKTLTPGVDPMYQWLNPGGANRVITLATSTAKIGDRFVIKNNDVYSSSYYLSIKQGGTYIDRINAGGIKEYIFDGANWRAGGLGGGGIDNNDNFNIAIGSYARGYNYGASVGFNALSENFGAAVGYNAMGSEYGAAVGYNSYGSFYGAAVGYNAFGDTHGVAVGYYARGTDYGVAVGSQAKGLRYGVAVGYQAGFNIDPYADRYNVLLGAYAGYRITTGQGNIIIGYQSGYDTSTSPTIGSKNILIGFQAGTPSTSTSNFLNIGNLIFATGVNTATGSAISIGNVGIGTTSPATTFQVVGTSTLRTILPEEDNLYSLGSPNLRWANLYAATTSVGDLVFANQFRFIESTSTSGEELLILKNQRGEDILTIDEKGNLTLLGKIIAFFDEILTWFKDKILEVKELIANKIFVKEIVIDYAQIKKAKIDDLSSKVFCLEGDDGEKICIDKNQLKELLQRNGMIPSQDSGGVNNSGDVSNSGQDNNQQSNNQENNNQGDINQSSGNQGGGEQQGDSQENNGQGNMSQGGESQGAGSQGSEGEQDDNQGSGSQGDQSVISNQ